MRLDSGCTGSPFCTPDSRFLTERLRSEQSMDSAVYKILYCSKNLIEGENAKRDAEVGRIFQSARRNNRELNVTGALFFNSSYCAQVLEGPKLGIEKVFENIQRDPRHGDVIVLS